MCGRFAFHVEDVTLHREIAVKQAHVELSPRYNITPTQFVTAVI